MTADSGSQTTLTVSGRGVSKQLTVAAGKAAALDPITLDPGSYRVRSAAGASATLVVSSEQDSVGP